MRAYVGTHDFGRNVAVAITEGGEGLHDPQEVLRILDVDEQGYLTMRWDSLDRLVNVPAPTMSIREPMARALLDGLNEYFKGASDVQQLRADLDFERQRCARLIDAVVQLAATRS